MAKAEDDGGIGAEVSSRLEELFSEDDGTEMPAFDAAPEKSAGAADSATRKKTVPNGFAGDVGDSPIKNLKALVFGIDWEITDDSMGAFLGEVRTLQQKYADDKILSMFLKLHESIGKYIKAKKARAHPDALNYVTSVFTSFEKVLLSPGMAENQKKKLLAAEVRTFKEFKDRILTREKTDGSGEVQAEAPVEETRYQKPAVSKPAGGLENQEVVDYIVEELKKTIKAEFHTMRQILKSLGA